MVKITGTVLWENPARQAGVEEYSGISAGLEEKKTGCFRKTDGCPHFPKNSRFGVDNYYLNFSILYNYRLYFPHPVKSNEICSKYAQISREELL